MIPTLKPVLPLSSPRLIPITWLRYDVRVIPTKATMGMAIINGFPVYIRTQLANNSAKMQTGWRICSEAGLS